jgi:hypothetical protein
VRRTIPRLRDQRLGRLDHLRSSRLAAAGHVVLFNQIGPSKVRTPHPRTAIQSKVETKAPANLLGERRHARRRVAADDIIQHAKKLRGGFIRVPAAENRDGEMSEPKRTPEGLAALIAEWLEGRPECFSVTGVAVAPTVRIADDSPQLERSHHHCRSRPSAGNRSTVRRSTTTRFDLTG